MNINKIKMSTIRKPQILLKKTEVFYWLTSVDQTEVFNTVDIKVSHWGFHTEVFTQRFSTGRLRPGYRPDWGFLLVDGRRQADVFITPLISNYELLKWHITYFTIPKNLGVKCSHHLDMRYNFGTCKIWFVHSVLYSRVGLAQLWLWYFL